MIIITLYIYTLARRKDRSPAVQQSIFPRNIHKIADYGAYASNRQVYLVDEAEKTLKAR